MSGGFIVIHRRVSGQQAVLLIDGFHAMSIELKPLAQATVSSASYQHAIDSGVYLRGVDSSRVGARLPVTRDEIGNPSVLLIMGQSNGGNHGEARHVARQAVFNFNPFDGLCYRACVPFGAHSPTVDPPTERGHKRIDRAKSSVIRASPKMHQGLPPPPVAPSRGSHATPVGRDSSGPVLTQ